MNRLFSAFATAILGVMIVSCTGETVDYSEPNEPDPIPSETPAGLPEITPPTEASAPLSTIPREAVDGFNDFSWKFYLANSAKGHENVCVSPLSVGAVLGMIANGDDGESRNEILRMLGFEESETGLNDLNTYYQTLISNLPNIEEGISCDVTNTLWCDPSAYLIRPSFLNAITDSYYAYEIGISPSGTSGQNAINGFVEKSTNGLIKDFLQSPLDVNLAFLNTIYFKASWSERFYEEYTSKMDFLDIHGNEKKVDFMCGGRYPGYVMTEDGTEAIRLDYGEKSQFSMTCILPTSRINNIPLDEILTAENLKSINDDMMSELMIVKLPKFNVETNNPETMDILMSLGLDNVGRGQSGFSLITEADEFHLSKFIHATKLKVDETGTEGAAASLGGLVGSPDIGDEEFVIREIVFDRPFIFYIQENTTGVILFIGSVKTL